MVDFSRAEGSRNHHSSFDKTINEIIERVNELQNMYNTTWEELEHYRKERAAYIENIIQIIKNSKLRTDLPLGRCNNDELINQLNKILPALPFEDKEEVECSIVRINNRYTEIVRLGEKLEKLASDLSSFYIKEQDASLEVEVTLNKDKQSDDTLEKVENITEAPEELVEKADQLRESLADSKVDDENVSFVPYKLTANTSLNYFIENVYGDSDYLTEIYNYSDNKKKIDAILEEADCSLEQAVNINGFFNNLTLKFPTEVEIQSKHKIEEHSSPRVG